MSPFESPGLWLLEHDFKLVIGSASIVAAFGVRSLLRWQRRRNDARLHQIEQIALGATARELELSQRLLQTGQLNADERRQLPGGKLRLSVLVSVARGELTRERRLPIRPGKASVSIELRDDFYLIHQAHGVRAAEDLKDAVETFVASLNRSELGAVPIDEEL
jgi:hypothetical protein